MQQILVKVRNPPVRRSRRRETGQRQRRREYMLAETGVRILRVERVDQEGVARAYRTGVQVGVEPRSLAHRLRNHWLRHASQFRRLNYSVKYFSKQSYIENPPDLTFAPRPLDSAPVEPHFQEVGTWDSLVARP